MTPRAPIGDIKPRDLTSSSHKLTRGGIDSLTRGTKCDSQNYWEKAGTTVMSF